jgi:hypothetical protein
MDRKQNYIKREAERARKNRQKTKELQKKNQAFYNFVERKYGFVVEEFEQEYHAADENNAAEFIPTATVSPYQRFPEQSTETLNGMNLLTDLSTLNELDLGDMNFNLFDDPYLNSILDAEPLTGPHA